MQERARLTLLRKETIMSITVIAAVYGTVNNGFNVTTICQGFVSGTNDDITVNNTTMGGDPDRGVKKSFVIAYWAPDINNGNLCVLGCLEGTTIDLAPSPPPTTTPQNALTSTGGVQISFAGYGTLANGNDVTAICQALVNQGNFVIPVNNATLGPDPNPGKQKSFGIWYSANSVSYYQACQENTNLTLNA
jgi:hypothetical protein